MPLYFGSLIQPASVEQAGRGLSTALTKTARFLLLLSSEDPISTHRYRSISYIGSQALFQFPTVLAQTRFFSLLLCHLATAAVKRARVIDYRLSEFKVVKLDINVVLNALTQTRSSVAWGLIGDDTRWDCMAQGAETGGKVFSLWSLSQNPVWSYRHRAPVPTAERPSWGALAHRRGVGDSGQRHCSCLDCSQTLITVEINYPLSLLPTAALNCICASSRGELTKSISSTEFRRWCKTPEKKYKET